MINFWNGNKSAARQAYELELLQIALDTQSLSPININNDMTDYPKAEDEGDIFSNGADVLATIAGNKKFNGKPVIKLNKALCKGLLGHRIVIIRQQDSSKFNKINATTLKGLVAGIPATWVDADLFRSNQYRVLEQGTLPEMLRLLKQGECDYVSLGANEVQSLFTEFATPLQGLSIEKTLVIQYSFPLIFYVHPDNHTLAKKLDKGLSNIMQNGTFDALFDRHYGDVMSTLALYKRQVINLENPELPMGLCSAK